LRNAIPRESIAIITVEESQTKDLLGNFKNLASIIKRELKITEPKLSITLIPTEVPSKVMDAFSQKELLKGIYAAHNGVYDEQQYF